MKRACSEKEKEEKKRLKADEKPKPMATEKCKTNLERACPEKEEKERLKADEKPSSYPDLTGLIGPGLGYEKYR